MNENVILIALAVLPVFILAFYVYRKDKFEKEPFPMLVKAFIFGGLSIIPAIILEIFLTSAYSSFGVGLPGYVEGIYTGYIVAGCSEELCKLLLLWLAVWHSRHFNEYFDGIVYAAFVSLGFAGIENIGYVFDQGTYASAIATGTTRAIFSVPGHFLFGVVMGYYFALAKFQPERRFANLFKAFFFPMLLHGTYDALLMVSETFEADMIWITGPLFILFIYFDIKLWKIGVRRLRHLQDLSREQHPEWDEDENDNLPPANNDQFSGINWNV